jgi:hypothetical protein
MFLSIRPSLTSQQKLFIRQVQHYEEGSAYYLSKRFVLVSNVFGTLLCFLVSSALKDSLHNRVLFQWTCLKILKTRLPSDINGVVDTIL